MRVLRVYHSGVLGGFRQREAELNRLGFDLHLVTARRWNEGGAEVALDPEPGESVQGVRTVGRHPYLFLYGITGLIRAFRRHHPQILDIHEEPASLATAELLFLRRFLAPGIPVLLYSAQNIDKRYPIPFRWFEQRALHEASTVYCCNSAAAEVIRSRGFGGDVEVLGLGVDLERFSPVPSTSIERGQAIRLGYVGRLEPHKGVHIAIESVAELPDARLTIVGDGAERAALVELVHRLGVQDRVEVRGFVPHEELAALYRSFDLLLMPSIPRPGLVEQFGRVAVEAMACGVPVIASAVGALPEVVGEGGILIEPGDAGVLAGAVRRLASDPDERGRRSRLAVRQAQSFAWPAIAERHQAFYRNAVA